jgi:hypothetical protein
MKPLIKNKKYSLENYKKSRHPMNLEICVISFSGIEVNVKKTETDKKENAIFQTDYHGIKRNSKINIVNLLKKI